MDAYEWQRFGSPIIAPSGTVYRTEWTRKAPALVRVVKLYAEGEIMETLSYRLGDRQVIADLIARSEPPIIVGV